MTLRAHASQVPFSEGGPDPDGFHLKKVATLLRLYLSKKKFRFGDNHSQLAAAFAKAGLDEEPDCALFWDCPSLYQPERTEEQTLLFRAGLKASNIWYGHRESVMWMQSKLPEGFEERMRSLGLAETYDNSGWCVRPPTRTPPVPPVAYRHRCMQVLHRGRW